MSRNMQLLLVENVDNLGIVGDVVNVRLGYARNYLLPRGLATTPTKGAIEKLAERRRQVQEELARLRSELEAMVEKMEGFEVTLIRSCNDNGWLYGSVTQSDIREALAEAGFDRILDRHIRIGAAIKKVDTYDIPIQIDAELRTEIKLAVKPDRELDFGREEEEETPAEGAEGEGAAAEAAAPEA